MHIRKVACPVAGFLALVAGIGQAHAQLSFGPTKLTMSLARTWNDDAGGLLASDSVTTGPVSYGPVVALTTPAVSLPDTLPAPGHAPWEAMGQAYSQVSQNGTSQWMRMTTYGVLIGLPTPPPVGHGHLDVDIVHSVEFQLLQPTSWSADLGTVLSSPSYPRFQIIADPAGAANVITDVALPPSEPSMMMHIGGILAPGSYRAVISLALDLDVPSVPLGIGGVFIGYNTFLIPAPGSAPVVLAMAGLLCRSRRRR